MTSSNKASPTLIAHIEWVQNELKTHRGACTTRPAHDCQLHDASPSNGTFNPVYLACNACEVQMVVWKRGRED